MPGDGFEVRFWGVRGSVPAPGPATIEVGGNTSCVEVCAGGQRIILDAGTGLRELGEHLRHEGPLAAQLFFSHLHWDHIQGLPFFAPAFEKGTRIGVHAAKRRGRRLGEALRGQMHEPYFPVRFEDIEAALTFHEVAEREHLELGGGLSVHGIEGNHPGGVFAWRIEWKGHAVVYATDTESTADFDRAITDLARNADVFIYDSQFTPEQADGGDGRGSRNGWGHSTMLDGARIAAAANAGTFVLFHHDPHQDDAAVRDKEARARERFERSVAAREGLVLDVTRARKAPGRGA